MKNLRYNDGAEFLYLNFTMDIEDNFGNHKTIELKPNGANIDVTDSNKNVCNKYKLINMIIIKQ